MPSLGYRVGPKAVRCHILVRLVSCSLCMLTRPFPLVANVLLDLANDYFDASVGSLHLLGGDFNLCIGGRRTLQHLRVNVASILGRSGSTRATTIDDSGSGIASSRLAGWAAVIATPLAWARSVEPCSSPGHGTYEII